MKWPWCEHEDSSDHKLRSECRIGEDIPPTWAPLRLVTFGNSYTGPIA
jgi:hypothetical protein